MATASRHLRMPARPALKILGPLFAFVRDTLQAIGARARAKNEPVRLSSEAWNAWHERGTL